MSVRAPRSVGIEAVVAHADRLDVRSPSEFADDHLPGAISTPVLDDDERARVGTLHAEAGAFEAKKVGAALVSRRIAGIVETIAADKPRGWSPLVYCWRGGKRSASLVHVLNEIGFPAVQLDGGYRSWRRHVVAQLAERPAAFRYRVVCGLTGSGKSRLLGALADEGAQVLDLEALAAHRGSVLGNLPDAPQPAQKMFESLIWSALRGFDPARPVFVEAESKKIGNLRVPQTLIAAMWKSMCVKLDAAIDLRVAMLIDEYRHFVADAGALGVQLDCLTAHYGEQQISAWKTLAAHGGWDALVRELLETHYDPAYTRSTLKHYPQLAAGTALTVTANSDRDFERLAAQCLAAVSRQSRSH